MMPSEATSNPFVLTFLTSGVPAGSIFEDWWYPVEVAFTSTKVVIVKYKIDLVNVKVMVDVDELNGIFVIV